MMWRINIRDDPRFNGWYQRVDRYPGWVVKAAGVSAVLVVVVPLLLLTLAAVAVGLVVFVLLGLVAQVLVWLARLTGGGDGPAAPVDDGRRNVRVIGPP